MRSRCKEFIQSEDVKGVVEIRRCSRTATKGFPYCWQHCEHAREVAECLNTTGDDLNTALLEHLTCQGKEYRSRTRQIATVSAPNAPQILKELQDKPGPSLGDLDRPFEILRMIISQLSFSDLRNFKATNSRAREIVIVNPEYRNIVTHAPETVATVYKTELEAAFSINHIHDVLTQSRCTICDRRAGYVFFPSFQRCCERCAWYDDEFVPISHGRARMTFEAPKDPASNSLPKMLHLLEQSEDDQCPEIDDSPRLIRLVSGAKASRLVNSSKPWSRYDKRGEKITYQNWAIAVFPMPSLDQKTQTIIPAYQCKGCARAQHGISSYERPSTTTCCRIGCQVSLPDGVDVPLSNSEAWQRAQGRRSCEVVVARGRQYTEEEMLAHFPECGEAEVMMGDVAEEL